MRFARFKEPSGNPFAVNPAVVAIVTPYGETMTTIAWHGSSPRTAWLADEPYLVVVAKLEDAT